MKIRKAQQGAFVFNNSTEQSSEKKLFGMSISFLRLIAGVKKQPKWNVFQQTHRYLSTRSDELTSHTRVSATKKQTTDQKQSNNCDKLVNLFDNEIKRGEVVPVFKYSLLHPDRIAIKDFNSEYTYRHIIEAAQKLAVDISAHTNGNY